MGEGRFVLHTEGVIFDTGDVERDLFFVFGCVYSRSSFLCGPSSLASFPFGPVSFPKLLESSGACEKDDDGT